MNATELEHLTDSDLLKASVPEEEQAFAVLYQRYEKRVFQYLMTLLNDATLAEDTLVEVMLGVWKGFKTFQGRSKVSTWIFGIAHHKAVDTLRRVTSQQRGEIPIENILESPDPKDGPMEETEKIRLATLTNQTLKNLSPDHREVLHLAFYEGLSYPEIARLLTIPVNTVKTRVFYAKQQLRQVLTSQGINSETL